MRDRIIIATTWVAAGALGLAAASLLAFHALFGPFLGWVEQS